jgi:hypothetical protein
MNRRRLVTVSLRSLLGMSALSFVSKVPAAVPEPTYTVTLPGNQVLSLRLENLKSADGRRKIRVWNQLKSIAKSDLHIDTQTVLEADGKPSSTRAFFGVNPDVGQYLQAVRSATGFTIREPSLEGDLKFGAPLFTPLLAELFIGKMYDFKRGGPQIFAHLLDSFVATAKINTLTLTAEGEAETLQLSDGPVKARKLRYLLNEPLLPEPWRTGVFYVGPSGEVLKCDTLFFGTPIRAKGAAVWAEQGKRLTLRLGNPDSANYNVALQADKQGSGDWTINLKFDGRSEPVATLTCDKSFRLKRMETPWHGRPFYADVVASDTLHWKLAAGPEQGSTVPSDAPVWFLPHWFITDVWEGGSGAFAAMSADETREGFMFPLIFGQREATPFTLKRLADTSARSANGSSSALRRYRFYNGGEQEAPDPSAMRFDLYTDGSRLAVLLSGDGIRIVRNGWEKFAAGLTPPASSSTPPPAAPAAAVAP